MAAISLSLNVFKSIAISYGDDIAFKNFSKWFDKYVTQHINSIAYDIQLRKYFATKFSGSIFFKSEFGFVL